MKKILSLALALSLLLTGAAFAAETDKTEEVLASVKERILSTGGFDEFESGKESGSFGTPSYYFSWRNSKSGESINLTAYENGIITSYYYNSGNSDYAEEYTATMNKPSAEELMPKAKELCDRLNPALKDSIRLEKRMSYESLSRRDVTYSVSRYVGDVPVLGDTGYVRLSSDASYIKSFNLNYTDGLDFADSSKAIDTDTAGKAFAEKIGMKLSYKIKYEGDRKTAYLSYTQENKDKYIDALTGEAKEPERYSQYKYADSESVAEDAMNSSAGGAAKREFSEAELAEITRITSLISQDEAKSKLIATKLFTYPDEADENVSLTRDYYYKDRYYYNFTFSADDFFASARVSANDGSILMLNVSDYGHNKKDEKELSEKALLSAAEKAVKTLAPGKTDKGAPFVMNDAEGKAAFSWTGYVNSVPTDFNYIMLELSPTTGKVEYFVINEENVDCPSPDGVIGEDEAASAFLSDNDYKLCYLKTVKKDYSADALLVYAPDDRSREIDAFSGEEISYDINNTLTDYTDIDNHWAENSINTLSSYGIGFSGSEFHPDDVITERELAALLTAVVYEKSSIVVTEDSIDDYLRYAYSHGILKKGENATSNAVTREKAAIWFVRALGYGEIASLNNIFLSDFNDVTENVGSIAILHGLGVISGTGENMFSPNLPMTRAGAATMIYNYFTR